jgi:hypothetical protein
VQEGLKGKNVAQLTTDPSGDSNGFTNLFLENS